MQDKQSGRAEQAVLFQQRLMCGRVGGYVNLHQPRQGDGSLHFGAAERVGFHFFAGDAPVGIKIQQHGLLRMFRQHFGHSLLHLRHVGEFLPVRRTVGRRMQR